jgi:hypothetical protein
MNISPRSYLVECALIVAIFVPIVLMFCAVAIACEFHQVRLEFASANEEWRRESFRRVDQLLWKADTGLEIAAAMRLDLGNLITKLRAQVKTSSEASTAAANTQAKATTAAVTNAIEHTSEAIQAASGEVLPLKVEPLKSPITVNIPAPVVVHAPEAEVPTKVDLIPGSAETPALVSLHLAVAGSVSVGKQRGYF